MAAKINKGIDLGGKSAIVTGAGGNIGRAISLALAAHGAEVLACDVALEPAQKTADLIIENGGNAAAFAVDVTKEEDAFAMVDKAVELFGKLDLIYNNAGICTVYPVEDMPAERWDQIFAVNCKGVFLGSKAAIKQMKKQGGGRIINTASQAGKMAIPEQSHYCATKAAVIGFTRSLAIELKDDNILVNCFCPGSVMSDMTMREAEAFKAAHGTPIEESIANWQKAIPLGRWVTPEDVADIAVFLASEYSGYMTGQAVNITGGQMLY